MNFQDKHQQKKFKNTLNVYLTSPNPDRLKAKQSPLPALKVTKNHNQKNNHEKKHPEHKNIPNQMKNYLDISAFFQEQLQKYSQTEASLLEFITKYYAHMRSIITKCEDKAKASILSQMREIKDLIKIQQNRSEEKMRSLKKKSITDEEKVGMSEIFVPYFQIEGDYMKNFEKIVEKFKPNLTMNRFDYPNEERKSIKMNRLLIPNGPKQKQNIQLNEENPLNYLESAQQSTIKKQSISYKPQLNFGQTCEFVCLEELQLNTDKYNENRKQNKHEIISEIILQQPSSCQDSLIITEIL